MKNLNIYLEDEIYFKLIEVKGDRTWKEFFKDLGDKNEGMDTLESS